MRLSRKDAASALFGTSALVGVTRGLAEFRAGRPVEIVAETGFIVALPVEGLTPGRLAAFQQFCAPALPRLAVTGRRALALGIDDDERHYGVAARMLERLGGPRGV